MFTRIFPLLLSFLVLAGCSAHKIEIQQGNILDAELVSQLHVGMNRQQVRFLLGSPVISDTFHPDRWDYVYFVTPAGERTVPSVLSLYFDNEVLIRINKAMTPQERES